MMQFPNRITVNRYDLERVLQLALEIEDRDKAETKSLLKVAGALDASFNKGTRDNLAERGKRQPTRYLWEVGAPVSKAEAEKWERRWERFWVAVAMLREERQRVGRDCEATG